MSFQILSMLGRLGLNKHVLIYEKQEIHPYGLSLHHTLTYERGVVAKQRYTFECYGGQLSASIKVGGGIIL